MFRVENISALYFLIAIPMVIGFFIAYRNWQKKKLASVGEDRLLQNLIQGQPKNKPILKLIIRILALASLVIALVNPQIGSKVEKVTRQGADVMVAIDVSKSMLCEDVSPNRIDKAKMMVSKLIDKLEGDRLGVIIYAGQAYTQIPMTTDYAAIKMFLQSVNTNIVPSQGTAIGEAILLSETAFETTSTKNHCLIILSDGENHEEGAIEAVNQMVQKGVKIHTVGIGTPNGGPIPLRKGSKTDFKKDREGNVVVTRLDPSMLQEIAAAGQGSYQLGTSIAETVDNLKTTIDDFEKQKFEDKMITDYEDQYIWFVAIGFILLLLEMGLSNKRSNWWQRLNLFGN